jgi:membrane carboxypeptidase/penicillin-binding protein
MLHIVLGSLVFVGACTAVPAGLALMALQAQGWMTEHTIELPTSGRLDRDLPQTATISSRDGTLLATIDDVRYGRRTFVPLNELPRALLNATMATEDWRYYTHPGVDPVGLARALTTNADAGGAAQGGSTIEMQLTRNLFLADERTERTLAASSKRRWPLSSSTSGTRRTSCWRRTSTSSSTGTGRSGPRRQRRPTSGSRPAT